MSGHSNNGRDHLPLTSTRYVTTTAAEVVEELRAMTLEEMDACWVAIMAEARHEGIGVRQLAGALTVVRDKYRAEGGWNKRGAR